jgi:hypothetical protein
MTRRPRPQHASIICASAAEAISFSAHLAGLCIAHATEIEERFPRIWFLNLRASEQTSANTLYADWLRERAAAKAREPR